MAEFGAPAIEVAKPMVEKAMEEAHYLCCYKSYVENFEEEKTKLSATKSKVDNDIEEARKKNENQIEPQVQLWQNEADGLIREDTKGKQKWFGFVTNCFWQYKRGKELARKTQTIKELIRNCNWARVARSTGPPGMKFYSSPNFMHFEERKEKFEQLKEALKDDKKFMIGLLGMGGAGKTAMAIEVGKEVEESKVFDTVIFIVVSKDANVKKIQANIAKHLCLPMEGGMDESDQAQHLWKRIVEGGKKVEGGEKVEGREKVGLLMKEKMDKSKPAEHLWKGKVEGGEKVEGGDKIEGGEKILIILDDVWEGLTLRDIGIPVGRHGKGCCTVLITTRDWKVCRDMGCHDPVKLEVLSDENAVELFLSHAGKINDGSSSEFKDVALAIVKECGKLPVAVIPVARALNSKPLKDWKEALERLQTDEKMLDAKEELKEAYNSLRLSYDNLKNENAKQIFLLCSLFPEDYEIPIELLSRIAIGLGLCGKAKGYSTARSHFTPIKDTLIDSCLLMVEKEECVKMHDLIREVALCIGNKQIQAVMDSDTILKENMQYSSWNINGFPYNFHGSELEVLLVWINEISSVKVPDAIFKGMENLKVLVFICGDWSRLQISASSLLQPLQSLRNVHTLALHNLQLGDISILGNLKGLETLELVDCSIIELPDEVRELEKLRLLGLRGCSIQMKNPFEVIGRCLHLEELYYVSNDIDELDYENLNPITALPKLQRYHIIDDMADYYEVNFSTTRFFGSLRLERVFSKEIFTSLVVEAEILVLTELDNERGWTNIIPDIIPMEKGGMKDLSRLCLKSCSEIKCLVHTLQSSVAILSKLVELQLDDVGVRELCQGHCYPVDFLKQLEELKLQRCSKLEGTLFKGELDLANLKSIYLYDCSMTYLFHPSTAESLKQLKTLQIDDCSKLKYIISWDKGLEEEIRDDRNTNQNSHHSMFPKLNSLDVQSCGELEFILPICYCEDLPLLQIVQIWDCEKLKYIFGRYPEDEGGLHQMGKEIVLHSLEKMEISEVPNFISIYPECYLSQNAEALQKRSPTTRDKDGTKVGEESSSSNRVSWGPLCCFGPKSRATSSIDHPFVSKTAQPDPTASLGIQGSKKKYVYKRFFTPPLYPSNLRHAFIRDIGSTITSLFTLSIASSLSSLETLNVISCPALQHIVMDEGDGDDHRRCSSIFPKLREVDISGCGLLECIFPASYSTTFEHLESIDIDDVDELKYVFGECHSDDNLPNYQNQNAPTQLHLPALKRLSLGDLPNMVNICTGNYYVKALSLEDIWLKRCPQLPIKHFIDFSIGGHKRQEDLSRTKEIGMHLGNLKQFAVIENNYDIETIYDHIRLQIASPVNSSLESMRLYNFPELRYICVGPKNHLRFQNLSELDISACKQLRVIFSASIKRSLPKLRDLEVSECEELMCIIEDDKENEQNPMDSHHACFPELHTIKVTQCKKLKSLFSISTCGGTLPKLRDLKVSECEELMCIIEDDKENEQNPRDSHHACFPELRKIKVEQCKRLKSLFSVSTCGGGLPQLSMLKIEYAPELVQVFGWEQGPKQKLEMKHVLPQLHVVQLTNLPSLQTICPEIDFHTVKIPLVLDCPNISLSSLAKTELSRDIASMIEWMNDWGRFDEIEDFIKRSLEEEEKAEEEATEEASISREHNNSSPIVANGEEASKEIGERDSAIQKHTTSSPNLIESTKAAANEIVEGQFSVSNTAATATSSFDSDVIRIKERGEASVEESLKSDEAVLADEVKDFKLNNIPSPSSSLFQIESPHIIDQRVEPSVRQGSKLDEAIKVNQIKNSELSNTSPPAFAIPSENESPHDNLVRKEAKSETIMLDQQALPQTEADMHSNVSQNNIEASVGEGPSSEKYDKASSSTHSEPKFSTSCTLTSTQESMGDPEALAESTSLTEAPQRVKEPTNESSYKETSNKGALAILPPIAEKTPSLKPQSATSATHTESVTLQADLVDISTTPETAEGEVKINQSTTSIDEEMKLDQRKAQQFEEDDLMRLFQIMEEGADLEIHMPYVSRIAALEDNKEVTKALADLEASLQMGLNEIASSEESRLRLDNALNILSSYCSEDGPPSYGLKATIDSLKQEIQSILSSFKQASATIDTFTRLEEKEKLMIGECSERKEEAKTLLSEIHKTENSMTEAQLKEAELKGQISKLQAELNSSEKEIKGCAIKLLSLRDQKKKRVDDTIGFIKEFEAVKKKRSHIVEDQIKARQQLENVDVEWSSCLANLRKTILLLGVHLQRKL